MLRQYFTNDLLNLNVYHHKKHSSKIRKLDLLETVFQGGGDDFNLNKSINQISKLVPYT